MSWFTNFDLLIRTCFALETDSQGSGSKQSDPKQSVGAQVNPLNTTVTHAEHSKCAPEPSPSTTEKTESVLSLSTMESSAYTAKMKAPSDSTPSYVDGDESRKKRHRHQASQSDVLNREDIDVDGIISSGRFGSYLLAKSKKRFGSSTADHGYIMLSTYHKAVLTETYQQHIPQREKDLLMSFDHPFVSTVLGSFSDRNCLYLMSPVEPGGPLSYMLQNALSHGITDKMKTFYAACVLSVLKYAHGLNIIHRGLHPDSLLIDGSGYLKVTDWGFAKHVTDRTYTLCGHVEYLCPEAIVHDSGYGKGADYWAFGVLIYEMFVGRSAFSPSSLNYKYDCKFEDRVILGTGHSDHGSSVAVEDCRAMKHNLSNSPFAGVERTPSPDCNSACSNGHGKATPLTADSLDLQDPLSRDNGTIENILTREPIYPSYMPHPTKSLIQGLCQKNMTQRLGTRRGGKGIDDIQMHIFFQDVEWARLNKKLVAAPWVPSMAEGDEASEVSPKMCAKHYPNYMPKSKMKEVELCGPTYTGYNCSDWNSYA